MATKSVSTHSKNAYIQGNNALKAKPVKNPMQHNSVETIKTGASHTVRRNQDKALYMDFPYVVALTIAAICALYLCVNYLHIQSSIAARISNIEKYEKQLEVLQSENDALETRINTSVDLDYVYRVATEELGMVYANKNQVLLYNKTESEYVRQYEDIPKH